MIGPAFTSVAGGKPITPGSGRLAANGSSTAAANGTVSAKLAWYTLIATVT
jgi:hypothetical protein